MSEHEENKGGTTTGMGFEPGDLVHVSTFGKGVVLQVRNNGRHLVEIKGRAVEVQAGLLTAIEAAPKPSRRHRASSSAPEAPPHTATSRSAPASIDLHGRTVDEAVEALDAFLNEALLAGLAELRVIHGKSGGRVKTAVHTRLRALSVVRGFRVDAGNAGVTIVVL